MNGRISDLDSARWFESHFNLWRAGVQRVYRGRTRKGVTSDHNEDELLSIQ